MLAVGRSTANTSPMLNILIAPLTAIMTAQL